MHAADVRRQYTAQTVTTGNPAQLVQMMYEAAIRGVEAAEYQLHRPEGADYGMVNHELGKAQQVLTELELALDHESGGAIATSLQSIYVYARQKLIDANVAKDATHLPEVKEILRGLGDAWAEGVLQGTGA